MQRFGRLSNDFNFALSFNHFSWLSVATPIHHRYPHHHSC
jgi:hypothetical protein